MGSVSELNGAQRPTFDFRRDSGRADGVTAGGLQFGPPDGFMRIVQPARQGDMDKSSITPPNLHVSPTDALHTRALAPWVKVGHLTHLEIADDNV